MITITLLTVTTMAIQLHPHYFSHGWARYRIAIYVGLVGYGIIPTIHWIWLNGGASSEIVQVIIEKKRIGYYMSFSSSALV